MKPRRRPPKPTSINILDRKISYRCPICKREFRTLLSLIGHGLSQHKRNLLALEMERKGESKKRPRRTELAYIKLS